MCRTKKKKNTKPQVRSEEYRVELHYCHLCPRYYTSIYVAQ